MAKKKEPIGQYRYASPPPKDEHEFQSYCHAWLMQNVPQLRDLAYAVPNGAKLPARKVPKKYKGKQVVDAKGNPVLVRVSNEAKKLIREGLKGGVADYFIAKPVQTNKTKSGWYHGFYIEFKFGDNDQQENQKEFEELVTKEGYLYLTVYDNRKILDSKNCIDPLHNFKTIIIQYLDLL